ncbi:MAG: FtsW/RodA/SpoVE family cell cycle protein, partial [Planctomycetota bacterium]
MTSLHAADLAAPRGATEETAAIGRMDRLVVFLVGALMMLGVVMVYSASASVLDPAFDWRAWWRSPLRQCVFALVGFLAMLCFARLDYRIWSWRRAGEGVWSGALFALAVALLIAMLAPGVGESVKGARRALVVLHAPIRLSFQPAEFAKLALVVWIAALLTRPGADVRSFRSTFLPAMLSAGVLIVLTGLEDFGTAALLGLVTFAMLYIAGAGWVQLGGTALAGAAAGAGL